MADWIVGLRKAAIEHRPGVGAEEWAAAEAEAGGPAPEELRALYAQLNGATFATGVVLFPLRGQGEVKGMTEQSRAGTGGLPGRDVWRFGRRDQEHLAAVQKRRLSEVEQGKGGPPPDWLGEEPEDRWVYVARDEAQDRLKVYRTLEQLLSARVPPAESEEFGERTFARARSLVEAAVAQLGAVRGAAGKAATKAITGTGLAAMKRRKAGTKKKAPAAKKKTPAAKKKTPAAKKKVPAAKKKVPAATKKRPAATKKRPAAKRK